MTADALARLTEREREVLDLMAQGSSNQAISADLNLSAKTIETHVRSIFTKLDLPADADGNLVGCRPSRSARRRVRYRRSSVQRRLEQPGWRRPARHQVPVVTCDHRSCRSRSRTAHHDSCF